MNRLSAFAAVMAAVAISTFPTPGATADDFHDIRRDVQINAGPDLGGTGHEAINFTGSAGPAGDTWITVHESFAVSFVGLTADVLIHRFNNRKGAGLLALYNETSRTGLALILYDAGNADSLVLATVDENGRLTTLKRVALGGQIKENAWYHVAMDVDTSGPTLTVSGRVSRHMNPQDPNSPTVPIDPPLEFTGPYPPGVDGTGEVGLIASAIGARVDTSVTNFQVAIP